jgi:hypothetical protein
VTIIAMFWSCTPQYFFTEQEPGRATHFDWSAVEILTVSTELTVVFFGWISCNEECIDPLLNHGEMIRIDINEAINKLKGHVCLKNIL